MRVAIVLFALHVAIGLTFADTIKLKNGGKLEGVVLQDNGVQIVVRLKYATVTLAKDDVDSIEKDKPNDAENSTARLAKWDKCIDVVAGRDWAKELAQIPATVIDKGVLKYVPYMSHKSGNYEFNIYGDPDSPACIEIGVTKGLLKSEDAKKECLAVILALLSDTKDQEFLRTLKLNEDKKVREGLTFEVTPETAEDAYGGWWISVYDEKVLEAQRASETEIKDITVPSEEIKKEPAAPKKDEESALKWTASDLKSARPSAAKSDSTGGLVYVRGYYRKNGTYVQPHTRRKAHK